MENAEIEFTAVEDELLRETALRAVLGASATDMANGSPYAYARGWADGFRAAEIYQNVRQGLAQALQQEMVGKVDSILELRSRGILSQIVDGIIAKQKDEKSC